MARVKIGQEIANKLMLRGTDNSAPVISGHEFGIFYERGLSEADVLAETEASGGRAPVKSYIRLTESNAEKIQELTALDIGIDFSDPENLACLNPESPDYLPVYLVSDSITTSGQGTYNVVTGNAAHSIESKNCFEPRVNERGEPSEKYQNIIDGVQKVSEHMDYLQRRNFLQQSRDGWMAIGRSLFRRGINRISPDGVADSHNNSCLNENAMSIEEESLLRADIVKTESERMEECVASMKEVLASDNTKIEERLTADSPEYKEALTNYLAKKAQGADLSSFSPEEIYAHRHAAFHASADNMSKNLDAVNNAIENHWDEIPQESINKIGSVTEEASERVKGVVTDIQEDKKISKIKDMSKKAEKLMEDIKKILEKIMELIKNLLGINNEKNNPDMKNAPENVRRNPPAPKPAM